MKVENGVGEDCCVKVAVHVRPLVEDEELQGCKDCITIAPRKPQVQIGNHSFTFDYVYGSTASPSSSIFEDCVAPLVDGLFQGYNGTVLAYGQTGSGKTYTMGTGIKGSSQSGLIPQVMDFLFKNIENSNEKSRFKLRVSFIEILKEEVRDLLDTTSSRKPDLPNGNVGKVSVMGKSPVQIRESSNGVITLMGSTEIDVQTKQEMVACLEQGSYNRATGSTNMNNQSSRSHAIFTITLEQTCKLNQVSNNEMRLMSTNENEDMIVEDYLCAKLHLVDLAGSERAKRTGSDGLRFKEGVHINRGLLALGNVISALGDEKKRKEGQHVPYRDSKLTRLLQDSLGGNSKTVMIACISPADINVEETLNTLKYANRARNIRNKPTINRDPLSSEMQRMRQQLQYLQTELVCARGGCPSNEVQILKERISWLEATNEDLCRELNGYRDSSVSEEYERDSQEDSPIFPKEGFKRNLSNGIYFDQQMGKNSKEVDEEKAKEWKDLQDNLDNELKELDLSLEKKELEIKMVGGFNTLTLKQQFGKKLMELENEKWIVQQERDQLLAEVQIRAVTSNGNTNKSTDTHLQKLKSLEAQILDLKKKQENHVQLLKQKQRSDDAAKKLQEEIMSIKSQKVQLQHKIKQGSEQFRQWKASREKELLQLRKEGRKNEYERHKLEALNQRQKRVLQIKTEESAMATKRLKELLESRKPTGIQSNEKALIRWIDHELEVIVNVHEVRSEYKKQSQLRSTLAEELAILKQTDEMISQGLTPPNGKNGYAKISTMSPNARYARIASLENMISISSNTLVAMASQLSEAEERGRSFTDRGQWNQIRSLGDAKKLLQYIFSLTVDARWQSRENEIETKEIKEQIHELVTLLRHSEARRKEAESNLKNRECGQPVQENSNSSPKEAADDSCKPLSPASSPAQKQVKYSPGVVNTLSTGTVTFMNPQKLVPLCQLQIGKKLGVGKSGRLWRWKRSHHQWLLQFKWKWQKPWKLSEWIRHSDETIFRARPRRKLLHSSKKGM